MEIDVLQQESYPELEQIPVQNIVAALLVLLGMENGSYSLIFCDDTMMKKLHKQYFDDDTETDVITFNLEEETIDAEIYIGVEQAFRQSMQYRVSLTEEITRLIIHGLLHLGGYTDEEATGRRAMKKEEEKYLDLIKKDFPVVAS